jgi:hypothetical protein
LVGSSAASSSAVSAEALAGGPAAPRAAATAPAAPIPALAMKRLRLIPRPSPSSLFRLLGFFLDIPALQLNRQAQTARCRSVA